jgi:hypothetical protein
MKKSRPFKGLLWTARIWATLFVVMLLYLGVSEFMEEINSHSPSPLVTLFGGKFLFWLPWITAAVGYLLAYWKVWLGGGIAFISFVIAFYPYDFIGNDYFLVVLSSTPSLLYLIYAGVEYRWKKRQIIANA